MRLSLAGKAVRRGPTDATTAGSGGGGGTRRGLEGGFECLSQEINGVRRR